MFGSSPLPCISRPKMSSSMLFSSYSSFQQDPLAPLLEEFERLSLSMHWQPGSEEYNKKRKQCIVNEVNTLFSETSTKLQGFQALLVELSIEPVPQTITQCKKVCILMIQNSNSWLIDSGSERHLDQSDRSSGCTASRIRKSPEVCIKAGAKNVLSEVTQDLPQVCGKRGRHYQSFAD